MLVLAGAGIAVWAIDGHGPTQITSEELRGYPQLAVVWGKSSHVSSTATGDLYVVRPDGTGLRRLKDWPDRLKDGRAYGTADAHWSPDGKRIALMLGVWYGDPYRALAIVSSDAHQWYAFPEMTTDEVVAFRTYDTERIGTGEPYWTPHSAFRDPDVELGNPSRSSIEVRPLCIWL